MLWYDNLELNDMYGCLSKFRRKQYSVRHQETCPKCGATLVNLYLVNGTWMCRRCKEVYTSNEAEKNV